MTIRELESEMNRKGFTIQSLAGETGIPAEVLQKIFSQGPTCEEYEAMIILNCFFDKNAAVHYYTPEIKHLPDADYMIRESAAVYSAIRHQRLQTYTVEDFYRLPDDCNVELIDGVFYLKSAAPSVAHQKIAGDLFFQIKDYISRSSGRCVPFFAPTAVLLHCDDKTLLLPDIFVVCDQTKLKKQYVWGAPDFVAEILSPSTADYDRSIKLKHYRTAGVRECWLIDPEKEDVAVYFFENDKASPTVYSFEQDIPVNIYSGQLSICLK